MGIYQWGNLTLAFDISFDSNSVNLTANKDGLTYLRDHIDKLIQSDNKSDHCHIDTEFPPDQGMKSLIIWKEDDGWFDKTKKNDK